MNTYKALCNWKVGDRSFGCHTNTTGREVTGDSLEAVQYKVDELYESLREEYRTSSPHCIVYVEGTFEAKYSIEKSMEMR